MNCIHSIQYRDKDGCIQCNPKHPKMKAYLKYKIVNNKKESEVVR